MRLVSGGTAAARHGATAVAEAGLMVAIVIALILALAVASGHSPLGASKVGAAGKLTATIALSSTKSATTAGSSASFNVTRSFADGTVYWVYNTCYNDAGKQVGFEGYPVKWGTWDSLSGVSDGFTLSGTHCKALVTIKPWSGQPLGNAILTYTVN
jgi:hypothetical protein